MKSKMVYVDSFPYHVTIGLSIIINTILVFILYHCGLFGVVWLSLGNVMGRFTAELFVGVEFAVLVGASIVAGRRLWKRKKSQVEIINLNELRILYGVIILILSVLLIYLFMHRDQGASIFIALALLFYIPAITLWAFVEKNKVYFECKEEHA